MLSYQQLIHLLGLSKTPDLLPITHYAVDSRLVKKGALFFALSGNKVNGHDFLENAACNGALAAIVKKSYQGPSFGLYLIPVEDPYVTLQNLAKGYLEIHKKPIIAVTGSLGKTTTKEFIKQILSQKYKVFSTPGNNNSQIGLPLAILNYLTGEEDCLVFEMGMTEPHQIKKLVQISPPDMALITKVSLVHAINFESIEDIALAKNEIFSHHQTQIKIIPKEMKAAFPSIFIGNSYKTFSTEDNSADFFLKVEEDYFKIFHENETYTFPLLSIPGKHNLHNFLAATVVAKALNLSWDEIKKAIATLALPERRLEFVEKKGILFVNDSYNAALESMKAALNEMPVPKQSGKKIAVLGEMLELGKFSEQCHLEVGKEALKNVDEVICFGKGCYPIYELWKKEGKESFYYLDFENLLNCIKKQVKPGDVVLLKGSRANGLWKILDSF